MAADEDRRVAVCGAGPSGAAFALWLDEFSSGAARPLVIDARSAGEAGVDARLIALSQGSRILLERLGIWGDGLGTPIHRIHVSRRGDFGRCVIERDDYGVEALGYVIEYGELVRRMDDALAARAIEIMRPARVASTRSGTLAAGVVLDDGRQIDSAYVVHAEGGLFGGQQPRALYRDYQQSALTTFVTALHAPPHVAWERFTDAGPLALLPAERAGVRGLCVVWCCADADAKRRSQLSDEAFLEELHRGFGDRLGRFTSVAPRHVYRLGLNAMTTVAVEREFAIGNAAQTLHPVAGQGLNLGLRDAFVLARQLGEHFGEPDRARHAYLQGRRRDRLATVALTDLLARAFRPRLAPVSAMRAAALTFLDLVPAARQIVARHMMDGQR